MGHPPGAADVVGDVLGRAGDYRQLPAQLFHIVERRIADRADGINSRSILANQAVQPLCMFGEPLAGDAAQCIEIARLGSQELARQAKFAVDRGQPQFEPRRFISQRSGGLAEPSGFAGAVAHCNQPQASQQDEGQGPIADPADPVAWGGRGQYDRAVGPDEEPGPADC